MIGATQTDGKRRLFVAWQDQASRMYFPVGELTFSHHSPKYTFCYLSGALDAKKHGFKEFFEFPDLNTSYHSNMLFSVFSNRLMPKNRPDFANYVHRLGLDPEATEFDILTRSGGRRSTDSLELFTAPVRDSEGCYETYFMLHGVRYVPIESQLSILTLSPGDELKLMSDFQNNADGQALALRTNDRHIVGYVPRYLLDDSWTLANQCNWIEVTVSRVNLPPSPIQQRMLCKLRACWPTDYTPCATGEYEPLCGTQHKV